MSDTTRTLQDAARRLTRARFESLHPGLYLFVELPGSGDLSFKTRVASSPTVRSIAEALVRRESGSSSPERLVLPLRKSDRNTWRSRISLGRATNNDLVLRHESVSKLHAHFQVVAEGGRERLVISDAGSVNGTLVNGRTVGEPPDGAVEVRPGDRILVGDVRCELLDAGGLYDRLSRLDSTDF